MNQSINGYDSVFEREKYDEIVGKLHSHRIDQFVRHLERIKGPNSGKILPFIRGLRFSSLLTYAIREYLDGKNLDANWGHIIDEDGTYCSRECDIIIHEPGQTHKWNGTQGHIMDFRFIEQAKAKIVISCKSFLRTSDIEQEYCKDMKQYVDKVWLFSECCGPKSAQNIKDRASLVGYDDFWHLYTWSKSKSAIDQNVEGWFDFASKVKSLGS